MQVKMRSRKAEIRRSPKYFYEPWLVLGDFNAVIDDSEVCGRAADTSVSMAEFHNCILDTGLLHLPFTGCPFTWHNCSEGTRSLWKRLDRMLVNEMWLETWPDSSYIISLPSTSDHSPLIINGTHRGAEHVIFRFDNYLTQQSSFLDSVYGIWRQRITGTAMYEVVYKLKALKNVFRQQRKLKGNLTENVYSMAVKLETSMLKQRAKLRWMKHGDQSSKVFFRKEQRERRSESLAKKRSRLSTASKPSVGWRPERRGSGDKGAGAVPAV
ncbi:hypothetical protein Sango_1914000 [Sesamum angolense]|uniref:Endonuclease/exonuclease/phosphatase domain-containing protein n=1 Tax=Sesamum angolense TaxID=2727404 RepID=A0AAE1WDN8_9LAMI|nr:hypothetical protein Sango_1914000 [Sesamum angolense]